MQADDGVEGDGNGKLESSKAKESANIGDEMVEEETFMGGEQKVEENLEDENEMGAGQNEEEKEGMQAGDGVEGDGNGKLESFNAKEWVNIGEEMVEEETLMGGDQKEGDLEDEKEMEEEGKEEEKEGEHADDGAKTHGDWKLESSKAEEAANIGEKMVVEETLMGGDQEEGRSG